jgi:hypothetical protein
LAFTGVELVTGPDPVSAATDRVTVLFDDWGVIIAGDQPGQRHGLAWAAVQRVSVEDPEEGSSGHIVTPVEVESNGTVIRFLLDVDPGQSFLVEALQGCLRGWMPARRRWRRRRRPMAPLVIGLVLIGTGVGLAVGLAHGRTGASHGRTGVSPGVGRAAPTPSPDQELADRIMLTVGDLPVGWTVHADDAASDNSPLVQRGQVAITGAFARCMGLTEAQASVVLGGRAPDQTAQAASPIFSSPADGGDGGLTIQLQTAASVVRTHGDEERDLGLLASGRYPRCAATATAAELQLGVDATSGTHGSPGPATGELFAVGALPGEQVKALRVTCQVSDQGQPVPVEVDAVLVGRGRIEADLEAFSLGGPMTPGVLESSVQALESRVATGGKGVQI